jgi:hypothetical protein
MTAPAKAAPGVAAATAGETFGPWNPGIASQLPRELLPLSTMFRPGNSFTSVAKAEELRDLTGLNLFDLVAFRPERLALHELLVRVTADLSVPSGSRVEDLGINFRRMVNALLANHIAARMGEVDVAFDNTRRKIASLIDAELAMRIFPPPVANVANVSTRRVGFFGLFRSPASKVWPKAGEPADAIHPEEAIAAWRSESHASAGGDPMRIAACRALARIVGALVGRHGEVWGTRELIGSLATDLASNDFCSEEIGRLIEPWIVDGARKEGFALLPAQTRPVIMNTKGASAAGKSTMRPEQRALAERIGVAWSDFALISPDIWRKQLLDYASLGSEYKYGGACTSEELEIIDQKLDRYMASKATRHATTHLLIDRFRFDSFAPDSAEAGSNLLTRFGQIVYLFFMITPPEAIVERAWQRGLEVGRYKAVDDLLAHNIDAYAGMPQIFFTWALHADKDVHCEFLDNTVPLGERPRTIAFGWNGELNVLDVGAMLNIQGFRNVNINAKGPGDLYLDPDALAPARNTGFLVECARRLPKLNFADQATGRIYLRLTAGVPVWSDAEALRHAMTDPATGIGLRTVVPAISAETPPESEQPMYLAAHLGSERIHTLGRWGDTADAR